MFRRYLAQDTVRAAQLKGSVRRLVEAKGAMRNSKKYKVLVRGENFLMNLDGKNQRLGFYTTRFVEAQNEEGAEEKAIALLRDDPKLRSSVLNDQSDAPVMFAEEIVELTSFDGLKMPGTGFVFYPKESEESEGH